MKVDLFYFIADAFPAWRSDVVELFGHELPRRGMTITWSMRRNERGPFCTTKQHCQQVWLPRTFGRTSGFAKLANRFSEALCEIAWFVKLVVGRRHDIIQVRDDRYLAAFWGLLAARLTGAKFIYWQSFPFPENDAAMAKTARGVRKFFLNMRAIFAGWWVYKFVMPKADHLFVQSQAMRENLQGHGIPANKMTPVPMGVPNRLLLNRVKHKPEATPGLIVYIGTLASARRLEMIIDAFALVHRKRPEVRLIMVGDGDLPGERQALEAYTRTLGIERFVRFTGFVPMDRAWGIAATANIGLSPVYPDQVLNVGSPTKLAEFMALGRPVVANHHPEQTAVLAACGAGLCVEWRVEAFAEAILWLLEHPSEAHEMGERGVDWVTTHRTYSHIADQVWRAYEQLLRGK